MHVWLRMSVAGLYVAYTHMRIWAGFRTVGQVAVAVSFCAARQYLWDDFVPVPFSVFWSR